MSIVPTANRLEPPGTTVSDAGVLNEQTTRIVVEISSSFPTHDYFAHYVRPSQNTPGNFGTYGGRRVLPIAAFEQRQFQLVPSAAAAGVWRSLYLSVLFDTLLCTL